MSLALTAHPGGSCNPVSDTGTATRDSESRFFAERALRPVATIVSDGHCFLLSARVKRLHELKLGNGGPPRRARAEARRL